MLFRKKKNKQVTEIEKLADEVKRYKDLYAENQKLLNQLLNETITTVTVDNKTKRGA